MENLSIKITYYAYYSNKTIEDFTDIEKFKDVLAKNYPSLVKAIPSGRGGGAYEFIIEIFTNLKLEDYLKIVMLFIGKKALDKITDPIIEKYLFKPLREAYEDLKRSNPGIDCWQFNLEFINTKIFLYGTEKNSIFESYEDILAAIDKHFSHLVVNDEFPYEIHIPVYAETVKEKTICRPPLTVDESVQNMSRVDYFKLWGLRYNFKYDTYNCLAYDLVNESILEDCNFYAEEEYFEALKRNY